MTSLNAGVIGVRLVISLFIQRLLAEIVGEAGIAKIGSLRNLLEMLSSFASIGIFSGVVKYVAEHKDDKEQLQKLFSTTFVFTAFGSLTVFLILFFGSGYLSETIFDSPDYVYLIKLLAVIVPFISLYRIFNAVVNGLSRYKKLAGIDFVSYLLSAALTVVLLLTHNLDGALIAIAITPALQFFVLLFIFIKVLREYIQFSKLTFKIPMAKSLLAFSLMSFFSTVLLNYVEIDIRVMIQNRININDAGTWTAMTNISKNYMVFSGAIFTLYVLPKFAGIHNKTDFKAELLNIYKTLLPLFGVGMLLIYFLREYVILIIYPDFHGMSPLFKWQLMGDFVRLASLVLGYQFLAKKMVKNFIFSEIISLGLFYFFAYFLTDIYGVEGVVIAHFLRYVVYFFVVLFLVFRYFKKQQKTAE
ncbi:O-antigen translocase [Aequorivita viscosa]|uniref:Polysaccharide transporter, PST family n=1 Tax=Aequorivita viscosa TaxID=797419 RepID=A0A1M6AWV6_9FLAO|nr:O-antigen translocase [Aequorivita viscosa]SDW30903.1 polysaccharide transporter, PST family [Aequorivita viscosa]SHI40927.1 polysaccharide transporter, PST family [Aequorivita viscosa]